MPTMLLAPLLVKAGSGIDEQFMRTVTRNYLCAATTDADEVWVRTHLGFAIFDPHPSDAGSVVTSMAVDLENAEPARFVNPTDPTDVNTGTACYYWNVTIEFGPWDPLEHTATGNPVDQPISFSFEWQVFEQAVDVDYNLAPVINSAGDPFDPPVVRDQLRGLIKVSQNASTFVPATFFGYGNQINNDVWNGFAIGTMKFSPPSMPARLYSQFTGNVYYRLDYEFAFNPDTWNATPIDRGYRYLRSAGNPAKILDNLGQPISQPALLNGAGLVLITPTVSNISIHNFQVYPAISFTSTFGTALASLF